MLPQAWELPRYPCKAEAKYSGYNETGAGGVLIPRRRQQRRCRRR
jgi:hypothetical protein